MIKTVVITKSLHEALHAILAPPTVFITLLRLKNTILILKRSSVTTLCKGNGLGANLLKYRSVAPLGRKIPLLSCIRYSRLQEVLGKPCFSKLSVIIFVFNFL